MTLTAKEAMQALLDGKIVYRQCKGDINKFKLSDDGTLDWCTSYDNWAPVPWMLNSIEGVFEEYPLTFREALKAMIDGKAVESEYSKCRYILASACGVTFAEVTKSEHSRLLITEIKVPEQIGKWKVIE